MLPRVFDMFTQERQALDRAHGGLGLGLAIVKSLVALHHGTVSVRSDGQGTGSEFVVVLPAYGEGTRIARGSAESIDVAAVVPVLKILVVDDNQDTADLTGHALTRLGHDVRVAYDGPSALSAVAEFAPDAALLDLGLPGMNGYELAQQLRARLGAAVRFVAISGYGQSDDRQRSHDAGFSQHLVKPINVASLQAALRSPK
jgi:CheY-like chemotaxis protein